MNILVTGGAGFIGSHVAERLMKEDHSVSVLDELNDYYSPSLKRKNLEEIGLAGSDRFHHGTICDERLVAEVFAKERPDAVIHLAARAGVRPSLEDPLLYEHANVRGTVTLLEACRRAGVRKFVFASSSSIYGVANRVPFSEEDQTNLPISPYAATKIAGEKLCYTWAHLYGLDVVCLRFFTVYGPRQRPDLAIRKFIEAIDAGRTIPVFGDGSSGRDYTFVDDTVQGILAALHHQTRYDIFNLGNSSPITLTRLIEVIEHALSKKAVIDRLPDQPGDVPITYADISKAQRLLGYHPQTSIGDGIARFVEWHRRRVTA
ncbi:MAG: NAD-dependent epimerase/dehydratase family protein [Bryobacterales bacterium]|nr:NAD-dependent epimerase/dehydratase family protein [Bryobacterales bacterium]